MDIKEKIQKLRKEGHTIYSISRLNAVDECGYSYWLTYHEHIPSNENIYGFAGTRVHKCLEDIQNGLKVDFPKEVENIFNEADFLDLKFPTENIGTKWKNDIRCFARDYKAPKYNKVETEKLFLYELNGKYLQGIIDLLIYNEDGSVSIRDYKTSSKFTNSDLEEKGRQLILYGLAMEQLGFQVKDLAWEFLKYVDISYTLKNGNIRTTTAERGYVIEKLKSDIQKELKALKQYSDLEIEVMLETAVEENSFEHLPKSIRDKYTIKDCVMYYDFSEANKKETKAFIKAKIDEIENFVDTESWWEPKEINGGSEFFCTNLCGFSDRCEAYQDYIERKRMYEDSKLEEDADNELAKFL